VPIAATMNCDTEAGTDSRDGSTSFHSVQTSESNSHSSNSLSSNSRSSSSHSSKSGSHSSIPSLVSSTTVSKDYEPENEFSYSDEEYNAIVDIDGHEPEQQAEDAGDSQLQEEWYVDTGYLDKVDELASKLEYATRTMELALDRMTRMSERLEMVMIEMRRAIDTMTGREVESDGSVSRGLFELTVTHLLDRIRRYEIIDFVSNVYTEGARIAGLRRPNS
jgi:hypothetical protein